MPLRYDSSLIDRFDYASHIAEGRRVLDVGGQHPFNHDETHPFSASYRRILASASQYECFDKDAKPNVKYVGDLNTVQGREYLSQTLDDYRPQVVLCMEVLEHLNHPHAVMNILAAYMQRERERERETDIFITIPNNGNWILNALNWHQDHNVAFFKSIAQRFVTRSDLGMFTITMRPCMQRYQWYWWLVYIMAFCQPFNWSFHITTR